MQRLRTVTLLDVSAVAGHHAMPAALLSLFGCHLYHHRHGNICFCGELILNSSDTDRLVHQCSSIETLHEKVVLLIFTRVLPINANAAGYMHYTFDN